MLVGPVVTSLTSERISFLCMFRVHIDPFLLSVVSAEHQVDCHDGRGQENCPQYSNTRPKCPITVKDCFFYVLMMSLILQYDIMDDNEKRD